MKLSQSVLGVWFYMKRSVFCALDTFQILVAIAVLSVQCVHRTNCSSIAMMFVCPSVCQFGTGMHCDHTVHFIADLSLRLDSPKFWAS